MKKLLLFLFMFLISCTRYVYVIMPTKEIEKAYPIYLPSKSIDDGFFKLEPNFDLTVPFYPSNTGLGISRMTPYTDSIQNIFFQKH